MSHVQLHRIGRFSLTALVAIVAGATTGVHGADSFLDTFEDGSAACWLGDSAWTNVTVETETLESGETNGWLRSIAVAESGSYAGIATMKGEIAGNWVAAEIQSLRADIRIVDGTPGGGNFRLRQSGQTNGWRFPIEAEDLSTDWATFTAPIDHTWTNEQALAAGWVPEGDVPSFQETLLSHTQYAVRIGGSLPGLEMGYDNVEVVFAQDGCSADLNIDGVVDVEDLLMVLAGWNACDCCVSDINHDRIVDVNDLLLLLSAWGSCDNG